MKPGPLRQGTRSPNGMAPWPSRSSAGPGSADPNIPPIGQDALLELVEQGRRVHLVGRFSGWVAATPRRVPLWVVQTPDGPQTLLTPEVHAWYPFPHPTY